MLAFAFTVLFLHCLYAHKLTVKMSLGDNQGYSRSITKMNWLYYNHLLVRQTITHWEDEYTLLILKSIYKYLQGQKEHKWHMNSFFSFSGDITILHALSVQCNEVTKIYQTAHDSSACFINTSCPFIWQSHVICKQMYS